MVKARKYVLVKHFNGEPKKSDLKIVEEELPPIQNGEYLCKALYLSVDPYMKPYVVILPIGSTMVGSQVAEIVESKNKNFPVGKFVVGSFGWRDYTIDDGKVSDSLYAQNPFVLPDIGDLPVSLALGSLGTSGNTAYFGFLNICQPKAGETVVVTTAAGAVGSQVAQIAKIKGCKVIGFAGSNAKCKWLKEELKIDYAFNYKLANPEICLNESAPNGVDCFFDNVGGDLSSTVIQKMNNFGRISVCGQLSKYNADTPIDQYGPLIQPKFVEKQLKMEGFVVHRWMNRNNEAFQQNLEWIKEGKMKYKESVTEGFENMFDAFIGMLRGENIGKALVKV